MEIIISTNSKKPIYEQIVFQIKAQIMEGTLQSGTPMPSMRALAKSLHVSVITVQRAYEQLQRDGFIETTVGRGTFVAAQNTALYQEEQQRQAEEHLAAAAAIAMPDTVLMTRIFLARSTEIYASFNTRA